MLDLQSYKEKGYLLLKNLFEPREVDLIGDEAKAIFISQMRRFVIVGSGDMPEAEFERGMIRLFQADLQAFMNCGKHAQHLISLHRLSLDKRIVVMS
jgi:phytanoyl-CoA hydroxylase